jgi:hypothetical protein
VILWQDNQGGAYQGLSLAGKEVDEVGLLPLEEVISHTRLIVLDFCHLTELFFTVPS